MSFWERSDSTLTDDQIRSLKDVTISRSDWLAVLCKRYPDGFVTGPEKLGTFARCVSVYPESSHEDAVMMRFNIHPNVSTQSLHLEAWAANEALARGFPTPRIVHVDTSRQHSPYPYQIIEYVDGVPVRAASEDLVRKVLGQLGAALSCLHAQPMNDQFGRIGARLLPDWDLFVTWYVEEHIRYCLDHSLITTDQATAIDEIFREYVFLDSPPSLLHGDLSYDNILIDGSTQGLKSVIDWEDAVLGDPIFELAGLATFHPVERHASFIDSYYAGRERPSDFEYRFWVYYLRIALAKAVHRHRFGYVTEVKPGQLDPDSRIGLALAHLKDLT